MRNPIEIAMFPVDAPFNLNPNIKRIENTNIEILFLENETTKKTMLYSHGNAETLDDICNFLEKLSVLTGMSILAYEYPQNPTAESVKNRIEIVYDYLETLQDPKDIILIGRSIGSGPTMHMIKKLEDNNINIDCVILISPLSSIKKKISHDTTCGLGVLLSCFIDERFKNDEIVESITHPLLLLHGENDKILPVCMSEDLFCKYNGRDEDISLKILPGKTHASIINANLIAQKIINFRD